jgi:ABC-type Co2+ transport system permease subunit
MIRERALKVVLVIVGLVFVATVYGLVKLREEETLQMMLSIYVTLGVFLLLASRNPSANRSLITFTAWSSFAHAAVMAVQSLHDVGDRAHLLGGSLAFVVIGVALIVLAPTKARVVGS